MRRSVLAVLALCAGLAAGDASALATAPTPLPVWLPPACAPSDLPEPIPLSALRVELGGGRQLVPAEAAPSVNLDGTWRCSGLTISTKPFPDDAQLDRGWQATDFADADWQAIAVPLDWYRAYPAARSAKTPYVLGWYRREVVLGAEAVDRQAILHVGVVGYEADLWVNGTLAGSHHGDFTPWDLDITAWTVPGRNVLALRVRSDVGPTFGAGQQARHVYGSRWSLGNIKGGLWQSCRPDFTPRLRFDEVRIAAVPGKQAPRVAWRALNPGPTARRVGLRAIVQGARSGADRPADQDLGFVELPPGASAGSAEITVPGIRPWSPASPELYWFSLVAEDAGAVAGFRCERFGFRTFTIRDGVFTLNGERIYLFGENLKSLDYSGSGEDPAALAARIERDVTGLKANGYTIFRTAHMPAEARLPD